MPVLILAFALIIVIAFIVLIPLSLVQRYRVGTSRRRARGWLATLNLVGIGASAGFFLLAAALTNIWVAEAFVYAVIGMLTGGALGVLGIALTKWERTPGSLHYTPNRWLVLAITVVVTGRVGYGFWRAWSAWQAAADRTEWFATAGVAGSLGAGAVVLGYYLAYWLGLRRRLRQ